MNYPFFVYPGYPFRGYFNFEEYLSEVIRLDKYIQELKDTCTQNTLLHLTIGAAMEEVADIEDYFKIYIQKQHWRQLFPDFIDYNCIKNKTPDHCTKKVNFHIKILTLILFLIYFFPTINFICIFYKLGFFKIINTKNIIRRNNYYFYRCFIFKTIII